MMVEEAPSISFFGAAEENAAIPDLPAIAARALSSSEMLDGAEIERFEHSIARATGRRHAIATGSCTDSLFFALVAAGVGPGDEVLVPAFSFVASASAIVRTGASPVFVDIRPPEMADGTAFTLDLDQAAQALGPRTKAMVWVGLFGGWSDPSVIEAFAKERGLTLVEDAAQSFGAAWRGRPAGSLGFAAALSFDRQKVLGAPGTGGAVVTDDDAIAQQVRALRWHGFRNGRVEQLGYNSRMSELTAAVLNAKFAILPQWLDRRREIASQYDEAFADLPLTVPCWPGAVTNARHKYVVVSADRAGLQDHLAQAGVSTRRHYHLPLHAHPALSERARLADTPVANRMAADALSLPIHPFLDQTGVEHVIRSVSRFFG
jgi:dTDP-4-amino-4,6-dideoxygalactose transaminase